MRSKQEIESELLLLRCHRGETAAFSDLTHLWERRLFYYIRRIVATEEDAWDVLQEVWLRVWRRISTVRDASALRSWLYSVAHNSSISQLRRQARFEEPHDSYHEPATGDPPEFDSDEADRIHRGLERLPPLQRQILTLFFLEEFSHAEITEILSIPVGTVKSRLFHAKQALRRILDTEPEL